MFLDRLDIGPLANSGDDIGCCRYAQVSEDEGLFEGIPGGGVDRGHGSDGPDLYGKGVAGSTQSGAEAHSRRSLPLQPFWSNLLRVLFLSGNAVAEEVVEGTQFHNGGEELTLTYELESHLHARKAQLDIGP